MTRPTALVLLACVSLTGPAAARPHATDPPFAQEELESVVDEYLVALDIFRSGDASVEAALRRAAKALAHAQGRADALDVLEYYASLDAASRAHGRALEGRFDALRDAVVDAEASGDEQPDEQPDEELMRRLESLLADAEDAVDVTPAARTAALMARLEVRRLERFDVHVNDERAVADRARRLAEDAIRRFERASQRTPQLEPTWVLARVALIAGETLEAERQFESLDGLAVAVDRPRWRERALLGLVGVARDHGASFAARHALERLATFRSPADCWALAREVAVQRLSEDQPGHALDLLEACPPTERDAEIDVQEAAEEWRALVLAAKLRAGFYPQAQASLDTGPDATLTVAGEARLLTEIALLVDRGSADQALVRLDAHAMNADVSELGRVEALVLRGRALLALGRDREAIAPLESAFEAAQLRDGERRARPESSLRDASAVGEWLGLSTVEALARANANCGDALRAAATIEAAHASCSIDEARRRLLDLAGSQTLGAVTWVVGADRSLVVHIHPDGAAEATELELGRKEMGRAIGRLRQLILETRAAPRADASFALREQVARAVLPDSLTRSLARELAGGTRVDAPELALLPHGVLERLPFESLVVLPDRRVLGLAVALTVTGRLRDPSELAPAIDGRRARWIALGAPTSTGYPELPEAQRELRSLAKLQPRLRTIAGDAFRADRVVEALMGDQPVHLATHLTRTASRSTIAPLGLITSGGEWVTADQIASCAPRLPLIVLAACGSAEGEAVDGLGVLGIAQAALDGGTRAAVVSLWPIADDSGRTASVTFHAALLEGAAPAEALRRARVALVRALAPPSEWAAYRLLGAP